MDRLTWSDLGIDAPAGGTGEYRTKCPKCSPLRKPEHQRIKDLAVNLADGIAYCHHCSRTASLITGWSDDPRPIRRRDQPQYERPRPLPQVAQPTVWENAVKWFAGRAIPEAVMHAMNVSAALEFCPVCDRETGHILFPFIVDGEHINTKHRCGKKHFRMEKGARRVLYNLDGCRDAETVIVVEGEMDALSLIAAGMSNVVSVPDGAPAPDAKSYSSKFAFLDSGETLFTNASRVILATDADAPGQKLADELARRIGPEKCARVTWDAEHKDANDCLIAAGPDYLRAVIESATPYPVEGLFTGADMVADLDRLYDNGIDPGVTFGYPTLDEFYRIQLGQISVWTGIPSHGKSTVLDQFLMKLAEHHGWTFALFSPEQQPLVRHQRALIEQHAGKPMLTGPTDRMSKAEMRAANAWVAQHFAFILPEHTDVQTILALAKVQIYRNGVKGVVIDPWNELEHARPRHLSETEYISETLSTFRRFAWLHDIHLWIVAHPTKMRRTDDDAEPVPTLWDISGSAHFRNKADVGVTVWRDLQKLDDTVEVHITKMRWEDNGKLGCVRFGYVPSCKRLYEIGVKS